MKVLKFGGSSVADATFISRVLDIVTGAAADDTVVVICSAISGFTDALVSRDADTLAVMRRRHSDIVRRLFTGEERRMTMSALDSLWNDLSEAPEEDWPAFGELFSTVIIADKLRCDGINTLWLDSRDLVLLKDGTLDSDTTYNRIRKAVVSHTETRIFVAPGFIASDNSHRVCTLGRGGSDYSAAIFAAALDAPDFQIWTDVPGIMTANPKDVPAAATVRRMSYDAAFKLADSGAKVLYAPAVEPARQRGIGISIRDTFNPSDPGSLICGCEGPARVGIALKEGVVSVVGEFGRSDLRDGKDELSSACIKVLDASLSDGRMTFSVPPADGAEASRVLHSLYFEREGQTELYVAGKGAVGTELLKMAASEPGLSVCGVASHEDEDEALYRAALSSSSRKRVFVDCTDSETIHKLYAPLLEAGVSVVSSNRRALAVPYAEFARMKGAARRSGAAFRYETTVGAALPILSSVRVGASNSDDIISVEATVSCTLNYILTSGLRPAEALEEARRMGLTEKDPSMDLCGRDALRKLLIIARTAGIPLDEEDVEVEPVDMAALESSDGLRYVASLERDDSLPRKYRARIGLRHLAPGDLSASIKGTDNSITVRSSLHPSPTFICGAGEGAALAAGSIIDDILK